jgi:hypothetical protein
VTSETNLRLFFASRRKNQSLPREEKIKLAESAAPPEISGKATVYLLERRLVGNYVMHTKKALVNVLRATDAFHMSQTGSMELGLRPDTVVLVFLR